VEERWRRAVAERPKLFDGIVLLAREVAIEAGTLRAEFFPVRFAPFMAFRDLGYPDPGIVNCFALAALGDGRGAFLLGVMGDHTANAGRAFFPGGTPDMSDVIDGERVDLAGSAARELVEETGMPPQDYSIGEEWHAVRDGGLLALMRPVALAHPAQEAARRMRAAIAGQADPELADAFVVASPQEAADPRIPRFMQGYLRWRMGEGRD
jgi:8-oxo-dGTP pyrophosphatase MutT (NUDIX family)